MPSVSSALLAGRYRLDERLAAGGFGEVWRAADVVLDRPVAIKLLHPGYAEHPLALDRFRVEARHAGALCHPNIARVYDYGEPPAARSPFLVMELIPGPSLAGLLHAGPLAPDRVMDIVAQVAAGLDAAHRAGLVHRDIKPGNLLSGPDGVVKISDFGISHAAGSASLTATGMVIGTPAYIAPERVSGRQATAASDLYSLGVVAYECLSGATPFAGTALEVALAHWHRPLPPLPACVPAGVAALVADLTAKDPAARPASAGEVARRAARLRDLLNDGAEPGRTGAEPTGLGSRAAGTARDVDADARQTAVFALPAARRLRRRHVAGRMAIGMTAAAAAITGLLLASLVGPAAPDHPVSVPWGAAVPSAPRPAVLTVEVNGTSLIGQPVSAVVSRLRRLGLVVSVLWRHSDQQPPGTVLSVQPGGVLVTGSRVTVTGALQLPVSRQAQGKRGRGRSGRAHAKPKPPGPAKAKPPGLAKGKPPRPAKGKPSGPAKGKPPGPPQPKPHG